MLRAAVVAAALLAPSVAVAEPPGMTPAGTPGPPGMTPETVPAQPVDQGTPSYRGWTLGADAVAVGLMVVAVDHEDEGLAMLSLVTYAFGAPLVHLAKKRPERALASVGLRVGLPILGAMIGEGMHKDSYCNNYDYYETCDEEGPSEEAALGVVVGIVAASAIDSIYLARGERPKPQPQWSPTVRSTSGGFALGVAGRF